MYLLNAALVVSLAFCFQAATGQGVEIIRQGVFQAPAKPNTFVYIEPSPDTINFQYVATLKASGDQKTGLDLFYLLLKDKARHLHANAFAFRSYRQGDSTQPTVLFVDCYYGTDSVLSVNASQGEKNVVYVFGTLNTADKANSFKVNNEKKEIGGGTFFKATLEKGKELKLSKGGFSGSTFRINWAEQKPALFLSLSGLGLADAPVQSGGVNIGFAFARITYMDEGLGHLLSMILQKGE